MALPNTMIEMPDHTANVGLEPEASAPEELFDGVGLVQPMFERPRKGDEDDGGGIGRKVAR